MVRSPRCGHHVGPTDRFCEECGIGLPVERASSAGAVICGDRSCPGCGGAPVRGGCFCPGCGRRWLDGTERVELDLETLAGVSDRGRAHQRNEDAMAIGRSATGLRAAAVCDGVSTSRTPELAARAAADAVLDVLLGGDADPVRRTRAALGAAARRVGALAGSAPGRDSPSCTAVTAVVDPAVGAAGPEITVGWVGDSRAYWLTEAGAAEPARRVTSDHSWAAEMVASGVLDAATAAADRRGHAITRWLGFGGAAPGSMAWPDLVTLRPAGSGVLLLCTDGLWNYLPNPADLVAALPATAAPLTAAAALTAVALDAGGRDNVTAVIIPVLVRSAS